MVHITSLLFYLSRNRLVANSRPACELYLKMLLSIYISLYVLYMPPQLLNHRHQFINDM